ncbi:hypothetical protein [Metabacillus indicus]|uniref:Uncharacterized protein n=1 Tax=Metabacillus indicus TaxID=246786 RepID=A0A084H264_METID|nr:hypothetical protein [Metabacillus indicus]KEZ53676.1 hypothetical protein GS18_0201480 [Metabacillus indicus]
MNVSGIESGNLEKVAKLIRDMPMKKWSRSSNGMVTLRDNLFSFDLSADLEEADIVYERTREICEYRLHTYFEKKGERKD